jgi:DNA primase
MMQFGHMELEFKKEVVEENEEEFYKISIAEYIVNDLVEDDLAFDNPLHASILSTFQNKLQEGEIPTEKFFLQSAEGNLVKQVIEITEQPHTLNDWKKHSIFVTTEEDKIRMAVNIALNRFKLSKVESQITEITTQIESGEFPDEVDMLITQLTLLNHAKKVFSAELGRNL